MMKLFMFTIALVTTLISFGQSDTHIHLTDVYRAYGPLPETFAKDSLELYRKRLSDIKNFRANKTIIKDGIVADHL